MVKFILKILLTSLLFAIGFIAIDSDGLKEFTAALCFIIGSYTIFSIEDEE